MRLEHFGDRAPAVIGGVDVALMHARVDAVLAKLLQELLSVLRVPAVAGGDDRALFGEAAGDRGADSARAAGDEDDAASHPRALVTDREPLAFGRKDRRGVDPCVLMSPLLV